MANVLRFGSTIGSAKMLQELSDQCHFSLEELRSMWQNFKEMSSSHTHLTHEEFRRSMGIIGMATDSSLAQRLFHIFDKSRNGRVSFADYCTSMGIMMKGSVDEKLTFAFRIMDLDESGTITPDELNLLVQSVSRIFSHIMGENVLHSVVDREEVLRAFNMLDHDGDRVVTLKEFIAGVKNNPDVLTNFGESDRAKQLRQIEEARQLQLHQTQQIDRYSALAQSLAASLDDAISLCGGLGLNVASGAGTGAMPPARGAPLTPSAGLVGRTRFESAVSSENLESASAAPLAASALGPDPATPDPATRPVSEMSVTELRARVIGLEATVRSVRSKLLKARADVMDCRFVDEGGGLETVLEEILDEGRDGRPPGAGRIESVTACLMKRLDTGRSGLVPRSRLLTALAPVLGDMDEDSRAALTADLHERDGDGDGSLSRQELRSFVARVLSEMVRLCRSAPATALSGAAGSGSSGGGGSGGGGGGGRDETKAAELAAEDAEEALARGIAVRLKSGKELLAATSAALSSGGPGSPVVDEAKRKILEARLNPSTKGASVAFGHNSWNLVMKLMQGIQLATQRASAHRGPISSFDYSVKENYILHAPEKRSSRRAVARPQRPGAQGEGFGLGGATTDSQGEAGYAIRDLEALDADSVSFVDYAPFVFHKLREHFGISPDEYVQSIGPGNMLSNLMLGSMASMSQLGSEGKSGSFFYFTSDSKFMIKTVPVKEHQLLRSILKDYYEYVTVHPDSLLCRILGCHKMRFPKNSSVSGHDHVYFVVMANCFETPLDMRFRFDLKGSWVGRECGAAARAKFGACLKDQDWRIMQKRISIGPERKARLLAALEADSEFLTARSIIDYSMLLGIHENDDATAERIVRARAEGTLPKSRSFAFYQEDEGGMHSVDGKQTFFVGIIDILTIYSGSKKMERWAKRLMYDSKGVSVQVPKVYSRRFCDFFRGQID
jgi:Ca2+-binding EF-hand superfamily protein